VLLRLRAPLGLENSGGSKWRGAVRRFAYPVSRSPYPVFVPCGSSPIDNKKPRTYKTGPRYAC